MASSLLLLLNIAFQLSTSTLFNAPTTTMKFIQSLAIAASLAAVSESSLSLPQAPLNLGLGSDNTAKQPNILFIISDDQDLALGSMEYMPRTVKHIKQKGTFFRNHFVTTALCCPSRVSLWTGRQAHNTNVTDVRPPYGMIVPRTVEVKGGTLADINGL